MHIEAPCVVTLTWTLADAQGQPLDELDEPTEFFFGGDDLLPKVEEALAGQDIGYEGQLHLEPEHAFGDYKPELVCFEDRSLFPEAVEVGMAFDGMPTLTQPSGRPSKVIYTVTEVYPSHVVLDGNHPLAGMALRLQVTVRDVREATEAEVGAGSVSTGILSLGTVAPGGNALH